MRMKSDSCIIIPCIRIQVKSSNNNNNNNTTTTTTTTNNNNNNNKYPLPGNTGLASSGELPCLMAGKAFFSLG